MRIESESGNQTPNISPETINLGLGQTLKMDSQENEFPASVLTLNLVDKGIKQSKYPLFWQVEEICGLLVQRIELKSTGNNEATGLRSGNTSTSLAGNRHDSNLFL